MVVLAAFGDNQEPFTPGSRWPLDGPSMSAEVLRTGRPVRFEDYADLPGSLSRKPAARASARLPGAHRRRRTGLGRDLDVVVREAPPERSGGSSRGIHRVVGTAIANAESREELTRLADEQAALRRVATLVAQDAPAAELFEAVCVEVARLAPAEGSALARFEPDGMVTALGGWTTTGGYGYEERRFASEGTVSGLVFETRRPARIDYEGATGAAAAAARKMGWRSSVGAPITVQGHLWGALAVVSASASPLPRDTERRLVKFTGWWRLPSPTPRAAKSSLVLPTSRPRCGAWPPWWRRASHTASARGDQRRGRPSRTSRRGNSGALPDRRNRRDGRQLERVRRLCSPSDCVFRSATAGSAR